MSTYPNTRPEFLNWAEAHLDPWASNTAAIGLSTAAHLAWKNSVTDYRAKFDAIEAAKIALRAATLAGNTSYASCRTLTGEAVRTIRAFAETTNNPAVYGLAGIPAPATPQPMPAPAQPTDLTVGIDATSGAIELAWKATNPAGSSGTSYIIRRRTSVSAEFQFVGVTGAKKFTDESFLAGPDMVQYTVQGQRADMSGPLSGILTVNFGRVGGGGGFAVTGFSMEQPQGVKKMAA